VRVPPPGNGDVEILNAPKETGLDNPERGSYC